MKAFLLDFCLYSVKYAGSKYFILIFIVFFFSFFFLLFQESSFLCPFTFTQQKILESNFLLILKTNMLDSSACMQTSLLLMKSLNKTETPIFLICRMFFVSKCNLF